MQKLREKYSSAEMKPNEITALLDMLEFMFIYRPELRATAPTILASEWMVAQLWGSRQETGVMVIFWTNESHEHDRWKKKDLRNLHLCIINPIHHFSPLWNCYSLVADRLIIHIHASPTCLRKEGMGGDIGIQVGILNFDKVNTPG